MSDESWRKTTYGESYDLELAKLDRECTEFKSVCMNVPAVGDNSIDKYVEAIKQMVERLRQIKSDAGLPILLKRLRS